MSECQSCGACCAYSAGWPIFTTESDDEIDLVPLHFVSADGRGMRCSGDRCAALAGEVGRASECVIYGLRPDVCRVCQAGDEACTIARRHWGLPVLEART